MRHATLQPARLKTLTLLTLLAITPVALAETLDFIPEMKAAWDQLTPGMKRNMCYWVRSGKTVPTRAKRVAELLRRFETGYFQVGQGPEAKRKRIADEE